MDFDHGAPASAHPHLTPWQRGWRYIKPHFWVLFPTFLFLFMRPIGTRARDRIRKRLDKAVKRGFALRKIGGVEWHVETGQIFQYADAPWDAPALETGAMQRYKRAGDCMFWRSAAVVVLPFLLWIQIDPDQYNTPETFRTVVLLAITAMLIWEFFYQLGAQWIPGAMVLDPAPRPILLSDIENQKALGGAGMETEQASAAAEAGGAESRLPAHDQEF